MYYCCMPFMYRDRNIVRSITYRPANAKKIYSTVFYYRTTCPLRFLILNTLGFLVLVHTSHAPYNIRCTHTTSYTNTHTVLVRTRRSSHRRPRFLGRYRTSQPNSSSLLLTVEKQNNNNIHRTRHRIASHRIESNRIESSSHRIIP